MSVDYAYVENLIQDVRSAVQHWEATATRVTIIGRGSVAPTIGSDDDARVFAFGPTITTAAYVAKFRSIDIGQLRQELAAIELPTYKELDELAELARKVPAYKGISRWFTKRPVEGEQALATLQRIDPSTIHAILSGIDAKLGSTPTNEFIDLRLEELRGQIQTDLETLTGWPVEWLPAEQINEHVGVLRQIDAAKDLAHKLEAEVAAAARSLAFNQAQAVLAQTDISVLDTITESRIRLGALQHLSLQEIAQAQPSQLMQYQGVGEKTATQAIAAARTYVNDVVASQVPRIDFQDKVPSTPYVVALARLITFRDGIRDIPDHPLVLPEIPTDHFVAFAGNNDLLRAVDFRFEAPPLFTPEQAWNLYAVRAADFHAFADSGAATEVPEEIAQRIADITLEGKLRASLRGYQAFGAKYALAQGRVLIGDEMGLGKTMQALAVMVHLAHQGKRHALVVCPPSLRINWAREITKFTDLTPIIIHGAAKDAAYADWQNNGGVAIVGFPEVRNNPSLTSAESFPVDMLVVDEAHRAKNPESLQSQGVKALAQKASLVMFMSGTPLENRVSEFEVLLKYLNPEVVQQLAEVRDRPSEFKKAIAHVYLRRNQADVLDELPPLLQVEEWVEAKPAQRDRYNDAVSRGHFMDMRQAFGGKDSAKIERVLELVEDGADAGKTIVFTYFRDNLTDLMESLGSRAIGPIAGGVSHELRQEAVDTFTEAEPGVVLVAQITAASEGLNIQAANRIILFEPQLNPQVEAQAVARAHRMGQVRTVEVHRLLTPDSVEEHLSKMLAQKRELFDAYARESVAAEENPEAMDVSQQQLIAEVIAVERERIGLPEQLDEVAAEPAKADPGKAEPAQAEEA